MILETKLLGLMQYLSSCCKLLWKRGGGKRRAVRNPERNLQAQAWSGCDHLKAATGLGFRLRASQKRPVE